jgi:hypothetical protein
MLGILAKAACIAIALMVATGADAQTHRKRGPREVDRPPPAAALDKRDSIVAAGAAGAFSGRPYWLALAECGGIYFKLNTLYTDAAVHARVVKPDPKADAEYTRKLGEAIKIATAYFDAAERFLMTDRGVERIDAVLTYDGQSHAAGERLKTIDAALAAAKACPLLYQACREAYPKTCSEPLAPLT